jgi:hypothetical protein
MPFQKYCRMPLLSQPRLRHNSSYRFFFLLPAYFERPAMPSVLKTAALCLVFFPLAALAADIHVLDRQQKEIPVPQSLPPVRIVENPGKAAADLDQALRFVPGGLTVDGANVFSTDELTTPRRERYGWETSLARIETIAAETTFQFIDRHAVGLPARLSGSVYRYPSPIQGSRAGAARARKITD